MSQLTEPERRLADLIGRKAGEHAASIVMAARTLDAVQVMVTGNPTSRDGDLFMDTIISVLQEERAKRGT